MPGNDQLFEFDKFMKEITEHEDKQKKIDESEERPAQTYNRRYRELPLNRTFVRGPRRK